MSANFSSAPACKPIIPIYPVRYGYINIFDDLVPAANPPELAVMMNNRDVKQTKGYAIRLLREGWVYIREEDSNELLHIFKYTQKQNGDAVTECFEKYLYKNKKNAQGGLVLDTSVRKDLPFAFVSADTSQISIVYTEHELSPNLIDRMHQKKDVREQSMQLIDLSAEQTSHSVKATEENLKGLVEDYRDFKERLLTRISGDGDELEEFSLDVLTTQPSYQQDSELLAEHLKQEYCNQGRARLVALFDPVGRQMELSQAHAKLVLWEKQYSSEAIYPYTIGDIVDKLLNSEDEDTREMAEDNIDTANHKKYWQPINDNVESFKVRRAELLAIFESFCEKGQKQLEVGSLVKYIDHFIDIDSDDERQRDIEINKLTNIWISTFEGVPTSKEGIELLEKSILEASNENYSEEVSVFGKLHSTVFLLITTPQDGYQWSDSAKLAIDTILKLMAVPFAKLYCLAIYGTQTALNLTISNAHKFYAQNVLPKYMAVFGIKLVGTRVKFTTDELARMLTQVIDKNSTSGTRNVQLQNESILNKAENALLQNQNRFNDAMQNAVDRSNKANSNRIMWNQVTVEVSQTALDTVEIWDVNKDETNYSTTGKAGILVDGSFAGLSLYGNVMSIYSIMMQTEYDRNDPLAYTGRRYDAVKLVSSQSALIVDLFAVTRSAAVVGYGTTNFLASLAASNPTTVGRVVSVSAMSRLNPGFAGVANRMNNIMMGRLVSSLIIFANITAAGLSFRDAWNSFDNGETGLGSGQLAMGVGLSIITISSLKVSAPLLLLLGITTVVGVVIGLVVLALGATASFFFSKNALENLLYNCFWGKNEKYPFWSHQEGEQITIKDRLTESESLSSEEYISEAFEVELQEFMNLMLMPELTIQTYSYLNNSSPHWGLSSENSSQTYNYQFILPCFNLGVSALNVEVYVEPSETVVNYQSHSPVGPDARKRVRDDELTEQFSELIIQALVDESKHDYKDNKLHLNVSIVTDREIELHWTYKPNEELVVPMRWLRSGGEIGKPIIGMINNRVKG